MYIAQANATLDEKGKLIDDLVPCRHQNEFTLTTPDKVQLYGCFAKANCFCCSFVDSISWNMMMLTVH